MAPDPRPANPVWRCRQGVQSPMWEPADTQSSTGCSRRKSSEREEASWRAFPTRAGYR